MDAIATEMRLCPGGYKRSMERRSYSHPFLNRQVLIWNAGKGLVAKKICSLLAKKFGVQAKNIICTNETDSAAPQGAAGKGNCSQDDLKVK